MPLNLASPGILVREVDLTVGRVDPTSASIGAIVSPFAQGPVEVPTLVENEKDLLDIFGKPQGTDKHYEHWMVASSFLAYGGSLRVVRADDADLKNANDTGSTLKIKSAEHYEQLGYDQNDITGVTVVARNPGSWANSLRAGIIDARADQILGIDTTSAVVGYGVSQAISATLPGAGSTSVLDGYLKGIITEVGNSTLEVKVLEHVSAAGTVTAVDYQPSGVYAFGTESTSIINNSGSGVATTIASSVTDWYDQQTLTLSDSVTVNWNSVAERPSTTAFGADRGARFDEVHVVVLDGDG